MCDHVGSALFFNFFSLVIAISSKTDYHNYTWLCNFNTYAEDPWTDSASLTLQCGCEWGGGPMDHTHITQLAGMSGPTHKGTSLLIGRVTVSVFVPHSFEPLFLPLRAIECLEHQPLHYS